MLCINQVTNYTQNMPTVQRRSDTVAFKGLQRDFVQLSTSAKKSGLGGICDKIFEFFTLKTFQSDFKSLFLRNDIPLEETRNIIKRYKLIGEKSDKIEYAEALYRETKRLFGFEGVDLPLVFESGTTSKAGTIVGGSKCLMHEVTICPDLTREEIHKNIFHELRHVKQNYYSASLDYPAYLNSVFDRLRPILPKDTPENDIQLAIYIAADQMINRWGNFTIGNIPQKDIGFAKKCLLAHQNYVNPHVDRDAYYRNFLEQDAYGSEFKFDEVYQRIKSVKIS